MGQIQFRMLHFVAKLSSKSSTLKDEKKKSLKAAFCQSVQQALNLALIHSTSPYLWPFEPLTLAKAKLRPLPHLNPRDTPRVLSLALYLASKSD